MILLFDLSKEHSELPRLEIITLYDTYHINYTIIHTDENVMIIKANIANDFLQILQTRLAFTHSISYFLFKSSSIDEMQHRDVSKITIPPGSIAVRYKNRSRRYRSKEVIQTIASLFTKDRTVDLKHPDHEIYTIITDDHIFVSHLICSLKRNDFEERKVQFRPFFSPISLHPKLARGLVNIAHITSESKILDPFCGTGGFLIEAGLIGCSLYGSDIKKEMIEGTMKNLHQFHISPKNLFVSDIGAVHNIISEEMDAVITDAPYGKSTTTKKEEIQKLYTRAFDSISKVLRTGGHIVIGLPNRTLEPLFHHYFTLDHMIIIPVHRSLTRYFYCGTKKQP